MNAIAFDTLAYGKRLQKGGIGREQAEAMAEATADAFQIMLDARHLASQQDIRGLEFSIKEEIAGLHSEFKEDMDNLRSELKGDMASQRSEFRLELSILADRINKWCEDINGLKRDMKALEQKVDSQKFDIIKWVVALMFAQSALLVTVFGWLR